MAQNMAVSVTLRLQDQFTGPVRQLLQQMQQLTTAAQAFNRAAGGTGSSSGFGRLQQQVRSLGSDVRQLANQFSQLGRSMATPTGGSFASRQVADMRTLLGLQQQALANQRALGAGGSGRVPNVPGGSGILGRRGFSPNASVMDCAQYRGVNFLEQSLGEAILQPDIARTRLRRLDLTPETMALAEQAAAQYARVFPELTRGVILNTFGEIITQFRTDAEAFRMLPYLLRVQQLDIQAGRRPMESQQGMLQLLRSVGLTGRLTDAEGNFTERESSAVLDAYLRAREIVGADINPGGFLQMVKYMKALSQTLSVPAILEAAIASPDIGHSMFGNQAAMLVRGMAGGRATKQALEAQARWGLRTAAIDPRHPEGPNKLRGGPLVDSVLQRENPMEWWRKHILGPGGVLRRMGLDPIRSSPARIADALAPLFSNVSAENIANMFTQQQAEWRNQVERALRLNRGRPMWERGQIDEAAEGGLWPGLQRARARIIDAMQSIGDNFTDFVLPPLNRFADVLHNISDWTNPRTGNPAVGMGVLAAGGVGAFMLARSVLGRMGPSGRMLAGGAGGWMLGGDVGSLLTGALIGRGFGAGGGISSASAGVGPAAAGAAGAAAGRAWGGRFVAAAGWAFRALRSMTLWGAAIGIGTAVVSEWETVSARLKALWADLQRAAPWWLGGQGQGPGALASGPFQRQMNRDLTAYLEGTVRPNIDATVRWLEETQESIRLGVRNRMIPPPPDPDAPTGFAQHLKDQEHGAMLAARNSSYGPSTVTVGAVHVHVTTPTNADPNAIGEAAGNALGSALRGVMGDLPPLP